MKIYGILAFPAGHSLSPLMQNAAFSAKKKDAFFERFEIAPENLVDFVAKVRREKIAGLAVSLPHKEKIIPLLDEISEKSQKIGAVNTVFWKDKKLCGENTDAEGFWKAIAEKILLKNATELHLQKRKKRAAVIGAGGAARAMIFALKEQEFSVMIFNRTFEKGKKLAEEFSILTERIEDFSAKDFDLVANASSAGLKNPTESPVEQSSWQGFDGVAFDAVFDPLMTRFLREAQSAGGKIVTGEKMLLFQGIRQFEIWTGEKAPFGEMQQALHF